MREIKIVIRKGAGETPVPFRNSTDVITAALPLFRGDDSWRETCYALFTDHANNMTGRFLVGVGDEKSVNIGKKAICSAAVGCLADGVILVHNHPSGNPRPSIQDKEQTQALRRALATLDIKLLDHVILGDDTYFSFAEDAIQPISKKKTA